MYIVKTHIVTMFIVTKLLRRSLLRHCYGAQRYNDIVTYIVTMFIVTTTSYRFCSRLLPKRSSSSKSGNGRRLKERHHMTVSYILCDTSTARHGTARHGTARHGTARHGTARHGTARHGTARHGTAQYNIT